MTSVLIADDQALVRVGLRKILETEPQTTVVGDHQGPGDPNAVGAFLLVIGRDSYTTYNLPASGTLTIGRANPSCGAAAIGSALRGS